MVIEYPFNPDLAIGGPVAPHILSILRQKFSYLGRGSQSFVFASEDGQYVLKFFRNQGKRRTHPSTGIDSEDGKIFRMLRGALIAYELAQEETGVLYVHLNLTEGQLPVFKGTNPLRCPFQIPLDRYRFVLQKRAIPFDQVVVASNVRRCVDALFSFLEARLSKGIGNSDLNISRNMGFLNGKVVEFDFGNYGSSPDLMLAENQEKEMNKYRKKLRDWLSHHVPQGVAYLDEKELAVQR